MDTYEYEEITPEETPVTAQEPAEEPAAPEAPDKEEMPVSQEAPGETEAPSGTYHAAGTGRKESPYANSPYEMPHREPPVSRKAAKKGRKKEKVQGRHPMKSLLSLLLVVALVVTGCLITAFSVNSHWEKQNRRNMEQMNNKISALQKQLDSMTSQGGTALPSAASGGLMTPSQVYGKNADSVVAITATLQTGGMYGSTAVSGGSGFVLTADGYIVTNHHVIEGATGVTITTHNGEEYPAEIIGSDSSNDVAVLKAENVELSPVTLGSSNALAIGDMVVAIGNPLSDLSSTQTVGYVSGKDRDVTAANKVINMIQTDAAINSGNSGGPLFNMKGEVVGITTAKYSGTSSSGASIEGIGFAIPIDDVSGIISDLMNHGYVTGAYMGITVSDTDEASAEMFGLPLGAYVVSVENGSCASKAGLKAKDIIIDLGGYPITGMTSLTRTLRNFSAGDTTTITVSRAGVEIILDITFDEKPQSMTTTPEAAEVPAAPSEENFQDWYNWFFGN